MSDIFGGPGRFRSGLHIYARGQEPLPPGVTEEDRPAYEQSKKWEGYMTSTMESCPAKTVMAGAAGAARAILFA
jgi:mitochondrial import inner membrane translocase subunit TIM22